MDKKVVKLSMKDNISFYLFVSPWIVGFLCFTLIPLAASLYFSMNSLTKLSLAMGNPMKFVGLEHYADIFTKTPEFATALKNTLFYAVVRVFGGAVVSYLFAVMLNRKVWGRKIFRTLIYIPAIIPMVGSAIVWQALFDESFSFFNYILSLLHLPEVDWLGKNAMGSVMLMSIWCGIGPTMIIILAALQTVPQELLEAAEIDGAGGFRKNVKIVLPYISSTFLYVLVTGIIGCLQAYAEFDLITQGGPGISTTTITMLVVNSMQENLGYSCALAWVVCLIVLVVTLLFFKISNKMVFYAGGDET
ncbi:MAG: carbohydrate ABC transporter permease [Eubacteriales bacterium]